MAKKTGKKPYKFRQARKDAKAGAKSVFKGKRKAFVKDITTKQTLEEKEALKELSDARKRQRAGKADFIIDDRGQRVDVKPTETAQERFARDRAEARRRAYEMYPKDETELDKQKARKARMEAKNKTAIAKQEADRAARRGRNAPPLQQTPANERPLSRPVKKTTVKSAVKKAGKLEKVPKGVSARFNATVDKLAAEEKAKQQGKNAAAKNKPQIKKVVAEAKTKKYPNAKPIGTISFKDGKMTFKPAEGFKKGEKLAPTKAGMTRAEKSAANKAAWAKMSPAERKNWAANKPGSKVPAMSKTDMKAQSRAALDKITKTPVQSVTNVQPEKAGKGTKKPKFVQKPVAAKTKAAKPSTGKALAVRSKGVVATTKAVGAQGAKKAGIGAALKGAGRVAGKLVGGRVGLGIAAASILGKPVLKALTKEPAGSFKNKTASANKDYSVKKEAIAKGKADYSVKRGLVKPVVGVAGTTYTVKKGDTLSGIAKANNTTLAAIREANPKFMKNKKYKQGNIIFSGTKVKLPKK